MKDHEIDGRDAELNHLGSQDIPKFSSDLVSSKLVRVFHLREVPSKTYLCRDSHPKLGS